MTIRISAQAADWMLAQARGRAPWQAVRATLLPHGDDEDELRRLYVAAVAAPDVIAARLRASAAGAAPQPVATQPGAATAAVDASVLKSHVGTATTRPVAEAFMPVAPFPPGRRFAMDHGAVEVAFRLDRPQVALLHGVLTAEECDGLIAAATPGLQRAELVDSDRGGTRVGEQRTSELATLARGRGELVARIDARITALTGIPLAQGEDLQVMRYGIGAEYQPHWDYFHLDKDGEAANLANGGQRIATLVIYLADVEAGGETVFPLCGLSVSPRKGSAVYFAYTDAGSRCDRMSFHAGAPVLAGEKWIATRWFRERAVSSIGGA